MARFTRGSSIEVEFVGGPLDGTRERVQPDNAGFLPSGLTKSHQQGGVYTFPRYEMDIKNTSTPDGARRFVYAP